jgi:hypothetical protein
VAGTHDKEESMLRSMLRNLIAPGLVVTALSTAGGCGGSDVEAPPAAAQTAPTPNSSMATCVALFQRQRACTDVFLPALVDLRVKLNVPDGIAEWEKEEGRQALIDKAHTEWASDSTDPAIDAQCQKLVQDPQAGSPQSIEAINQCLGESACGEFVDCTLPILQAHLEAQL